MKKIAFVDLLFNWPPNGGSFVDLKELMCNLGKKFNYKVKLFVPYYPFSFPRGVIKEDPGVDIEKIEFNFFTFNLFSLTKKFLEKIDEYKPDTVFLGDGYFFKFHLASKLIERKYKVILRSYAYELICPIIFGYNNMEKRNCENNFFKNSFYCLYCLHRHTLPLNQIIKLILYPILKRPPGTLFHEFYASLAFMPFFKNMARDVIKNSNHIIVYNEFLKNILKQYNDNISVIPTGIALERFQPGKKHNKNIKTIFLSGRINDPLKGYDILNKACEILWQKRHDFRLAVTFNGPVPEKKEFIVNLGWLTPEKLVEAYQNCDMCIVPSIWREAHGIVPIEAMACEKPVIASDIGGLKESVVDGVTGYLVPPGDIYLLSEKIDYLLDNPDVIEKMGREGRKRVEEKYSWDRIINDFYLPIL